MYRDPQVHRVTTLHNGSSPTWGNSLMRGLLSELWCINSVTYSFVWGLSPVIYSWHSPLWPLVYIQNIFKEFTFLVIIKWSVPINKLATQDEQFTFLTCFYSWTRLGDNCSLDIDIHALVLLWPSESLKTHWKMSGSTQYTCNKSVQKRSTFSLLTYF